MRSALALLPILLACGEVDDEDAPEPLSDCDAIDGDDLIVVDAAIDGDTLTTEVSYGGGCENHVFSLCWPDKAILESEPVQINLVIWHHDNGDSCEASLEETLEFDLTPLADEYRDGYGSGGTIDLSVNDWSGTYEVSDP